MKRIKYIIAILIFIMCLNVDALTECSTSELNRLNELAKNIDFSYEYQVEEVKPMESSEEVNFEVKYKITAHNLPADLIIRINSDNNNRFTEKNNTVDGFLNGENVKVDTLAYTSNLCSGKVISTKTINLPYFNIWSLRDECEENKDFKYCQEYGRYNISEDTFLKELEDYKNKPLIDKVVKNESVNNFLKQYGIYIGALAFLVIVGAVTFVIVNKKRNKEDRDL